MIEDKSPGLSRALGRWPNAPLALVVAQVRFESQPDTAPDAVSERVLTATDQSHPHTSPLAPVSAIIGQQSPVAAPPFFATPVGLDLRNDDNTEVIRLQIGSLTFISSAYQDFRIFISQWQTLMGALCEDRKLRVVRLGLRYIDFIIPKKGNVPEDYFLGDLGRSPRILGEQSPVSFNLYDYPLDDSGYLRVQYGRGFGPPKLPPDLQDSVLLPSRFSAFQVGLSAVLDMDCWRVVSQHSGAADITHRLDRLHADISRSFRSIISPLAESEWSQNTKGD